MSITDLVSSDNYVSYCLKLDQTKYPTSYDVETIVEKSYEGKLYFLEYFLEKKFNLQDQLIEGAIIRLSQKNKNTIAIWFINYVIDKGIICKKNMEKIGYTLLLEGHHISTGIIESLIDKNFTIVPEILDEYGAEIWDLNESRVVYILDHSTTETIQILFDSCVIDMNESLVQIFIDHKYPVKMTYNFNDLFDKLSENFKCKHANLSLMAVSNVVSYLEKLKGLGFVYEKDSTHGNFYFLEKISNAYKNL